MTNNQIVLNNSYDPWSDLTTTYETATGDTTGAKFDWTQTSYDACGRVLETKTNRSDGTVDSTVDDTYDGLGREIASSDSTISGLPGLNVYDASGDQLKTWDDGDCTSSYLDSRATLASYDAEQASVSTEQAAQSAATTTTYDHAHEPLEVTAPDGSTENCAYANGEPTSESTSSGGTATQTYNLDGSVHAEQDPSSLTTTYTYDELGRETSAQAGSAPASSLSYNTLGWSLATTNPNSVTTSATYDLYGRVQNAHVGSENATIDTYDNCGRTLTETEPNGETVTYSYDLFGNLSEEKHVQPGTPPTTLKDTLTEYDSLGRPSAAYDTVTNAKESWSYPQNTPPTTGQTLTSLNYDRTPANQLTTNITLDGQGNEYSRTSSDQAGDQVVHTVTARDDAQNWTQATVQAFGGGGNLTLQRSFASDTGYLQSQSGAGYASGGQASYTYYPAKDNQGQPVAQAGLLNTETDQLALGPTISDTYGYDTSGVAAGRLTSATTNGVAESYQYDSSGNLKSDTEGGTSTSYSYDSQGRNELQSTTTGSQTTLYYWDENLPCAYGWRTSQGPSASPHQIQYGYSGDGQLTTYTNSSANPVTASYVYDANGERTQYAVTANGQAQVVTSYTYDDDGTLLSLSASQGSGSWSIDCLYDEEGTPYGGVYRASGSSTPQYFEMVTDIRGDVVELLDANGNAFAAYRYDPWGLPTGAGNYATGIWTQSTSLVGSTLAGQIASRQVLRYAGYVFDSDTGLYYCSARYYDPATRQWITPDPDGADGQASRYQYCDGNSTVSVDSSGTATVKLQQSPNWSGYCREKNKRIVGALGSFNLSASRNGGFATAWVGIGGTSANSDPWHLLQAGVDMSKLKLATPWHPWQGWSAHHWAWWEEFDGTRTGPSTAVHAVFEVNPGDVMHVYVLKDTDKTNTFTIYLGDDQKGVTWHHTVIFHNTNHSAEWIVEKPGDDHTKNLLGDFSKVAFTGCRWFDGTGYLSMNYGSGVIFRDQYVEAHLGRWYGHEVTPTKIGNDNQSFSITSNAKGY